MNHTNIITLSVKLYIVYVIIFSRKRRDLSMKKSFIIAAAAALSMTACSLPFNSETSLNVGQASKETIEADPGSEAESAVSTGDSSTEYASAENSSTENITDNSGEFYRTTDGSPVYMTVKKYYYETADDEERTQLYEGHNESLMIIDEEKEKFPELDKKLTELHKSKTAEMDEAYKEGVKNAKSDLEGGYLAGPYSDTRDANLQRSDSNVLSFYYEFYNYMNGAHGSYGIDPYTIDVNTGEEISLSDILTTDNDKLIKILTEKLNEDARNKGVKPEEAYFELDENLSHYQIGASDEDRANSESDYENYVTPYTWYLDNEGIHFYFGIYEIAPYAYGASDVLIAYDEMPEIFNEKYIPGSKNIPFIKNIGSLYETVIDIDGDGISENVSFDYGYDSDDYNYINSLTLKIDNKSATFNDIYMSSGGQYAKYYHVRTGDNRNYIYVSNPADNDYYDFYVFDINDNDVKAISSEYGASFTYTLAYKEIKGSEDSGELILSKPDNFYLGSRLDLFGTLVCIGRYQIGSDGLPELDSDFYELSWFGSDPITLKEDTIFDIVDEDGNLISESETIKSGERFTPLILRVIEGKMALDAKISDGRIVRIKYSTTDYPAEYDGKIINDLFDGLIYVG